MSLFTAQLHPGRALGFLVLGASLHDVLTRLKAEPQRFPKLDLSYSPTNPVTEPVVLALPANGVRLRFDGREQRLRLIEILDFAKNHIFFKEQNKDRDLVKPTSDPASPPSGPTFRHIYSRFLGPTYDGEFIPGEGDDKSAGVYVLSYPGVAFTFPMAAAAYSPDKDVVSLLSTPSSLAAISMAVFSGDSWAQARERLWTEVLPPVKTFGPLAKGKELSPDEVSLVRIHGGGRLQLFRRWTSASFWITLGATTPQMLVAELGPPDAIYRRSDQRMYIHKIRTASSSRTRPGDADPMRRRHHHSHSHSHSHSQRRHRRRQDDPLTDTDQSSVPTTASEEEGDDYDDGDDDDDDEDEDEAMEDEFAGNVSGECFFNYFYLGFDVLISTSTPPSRLPPVRVAGDQPEDSTAGTGSGSGSGSGSSSEAGNNANGTADYGGAGPSLGPGPVQTLTIESPDRLVATKVVLHGNVPGSYPFNRHRRCRWDIAYLAEEVGTVDSETQFSQIEAGLHNAWRAIYASDEEARQRQRGMVLNRGWGDSPGSSIELLGGWEGHKSGAFRGGSSAEDSTTTLYGFPGLVFEVLKNGYVGALTVF